MTFETSLTITSETSHLALLRQWVDDSARKAGCDDFPPETVMPCKASLIEAVDNAIFHAHKKKAELPIDICLKADRRLVTLTVSDLGGGFEYPAKCELEEFAEHGRGLFIIKSFAKSVVSKVAGKKHTLSMIFGA